MTTQPPSHKSVISRFDAAANGLIIWLARHWLALFNTAWAIYLFTPMLAPIFMHLGWTLPAQAIYTFYSVLCHQLPDHSYFFFGPTLAPQDAELIAGGMSASMSLFAQRAFIGSVETGWKVALCQRDVAIYAAVLVGGLIYGLVRDRIRPLPFKVFIVLCIPIAVDGLTQLVGWRESTWLLRTLTGALFGFAAVWLAYPYVEDAMAEVLEGEMAQREMGSYGAGQPPRRREDTKIHEESEG
jgi:uncharacterized membrane protein